MSEIAILKLSEIGYFIYWSQIFLLDISVQLQIKSFEYDSLCYTRKKWTTD